MKEKKEYISKWKLLGVNKKQRDKIYSRSREKAKTKLKQKYPTEYYSFVSEHLNEEYNKRMLKLKEKEKGGLKENGIL